MKAKAIETQTSSWPAGVPFFDPERTPQMTTASSLPRRASVGPIELRINGGDGPAAIAILE